MTKPKGKKPPTIFVIALLPHREAEPVAYLSTDLLLTKDRALALEFGKGCDSWLKTGYLKRAQNLSEQPHDLGEVMVVVYDPPKVEEKKVPTLLFPGDN